MRSVIRWGIIFGLCISVAVIAQVPGLPGFPSSPSSSGSAAAAYWFDGGLTADGGHGIFSYDPIVAQDGGMALRVASVVSPVGSNLYTTPPTKSALEVTSSIAITDYYPTGSAPILNFIMASKSRGGIAGTDSTYVGSGYGNNGITLLPGSPAGDPNSSGGVYFKGSIVSAFDSYGDWCLGCGATIQYGSSWPLVTADVRLLVKGAGNYAGSDIQRWVVSSASPSSPPKLAVKNTGEMRSSVAAGVVAFSSDTTGALWDLGPGTNDHFVSNGTRAGTPGDFEWSGTTGTQIWGSGNSTMGLLNAGITAGTATRNEGAWKIFNAAALDDGDAVLTVCHGALCSYDLIVRKSEPVQAYYGIAIGPLDTADGGTAAPIRISDRFFFVSDGGAVGAQSTRDEYIDLNSGISGIASNSECATSQPDGVAQTAGIMTNCYLSLFPDAGTGVVFRFANIGGGPATPVVGTYSARLFSP